jgi:hypothetical protein
MRIILQSRSHRYVIAPAVHSYQAAAEGSIQPDGSRRLTVKTMTNKIMRKAHAVLFALIVLVTLIQEVMK